MIEAFGFAPVKMDKTVATDLFRRCAIYFGNHRALHALSQHQTGDHTMRKAVLITAAAATLGMTLAAAPAEARYYHRGGWGWGPGIGLGIAAGALAAGAYGAYGPYGYGPYYRPRYVYGPGPYAYYGPAITGPVTIATIDVKSPEQASGLFHRRRCPQAQRGKPLRRLHR